MLINYGGWTYKVCSSFTYFPHFLSTAKNIPSDVISFVLRGHSNELLLITFAEKYEREMPKQEKKKINISWIFQMVSGVLRKLLGGVGVKYDLVNNPMEVR